MANILGLMSTEQLNDKYSLNVRRQIFHQYPNGASPLMGLLSMMGDGGKTDKAEWGWEEKRFQTFQTTTVQANSAGPFTDTTGSAGAVGTDLTAAGWSKAIDLIIRVKVASMDTMQVRDVIQFRNIPGTSSSEKTFQGIITAVYPTTNTIDVQLTAAVANVLNTTAANGLDIIMIGSAVAEGDRSGTGFTLWPNDVYNYTQIHRNAFHFTRTALQAGLKFDSSGVYKTTAKDNSIKHMKGLEYAALFGDRSQNVAVTNDDNETTTRRTMGGLMWYLKQWELGNVANGGAFEYRPDGADITATAWASDDNKRIIDVNGTLTKDEFNDLIERAFRYTNDASHEKLFLCGGGILSAFNKFVDHESLRTIKLSTDETYGMNVTTWESPFGTIHFKTHPLLNQTPAFRNSGFILDCGEMQYTPLNGGDTDLYKNRQARDYDGRKDEWLTEAGVEFRYPENHMFIDRLTGITT